MSPAQVLFLLFISFVLIGCAILLLLVALWRFFVVNPTAYRKSMQGFRSGSVLNTHHGMIIDSNGVVLPSDGPIVTGTKSIFFPLVGAAIYLFVDWILLISLSPPTV